MKTKGADDSECGTSDIFFVEIKLLEGEYEEMAVTRFCMVKPSDNGITFRALHLLCLYLKTGSYSHIQLLYAHICVFVYLELLRCYCVFVPFLLHVI